MDPHNVTNTCQTKHPTARATAANADAHVAEETEIATAAPIRTAAHATIAVKVVARAATVKAAVVNAAAIAKVAKSALANAVLQNPHP